MTTKAKAPLQSDQPYTAVIGDMLASRSLQSSERLEVQTRFNEFIQELNLKYRKSILSKFAITLGDEFQGILTNATVLPDIIWDFSSRAKVLSQLPEFRLGIGYGRIDTIIPPQAINLDGPALHNARTAIENAKARKILGGVFFGFGETIDIVANGIARLLRFHIIKRSETQLRIIDLLRQGRTQIEIAKIIDRTSQAVNDHKTVAGWESYQAGEQALRKILSLAGHNDLP